MNDTPAPQILTNAERVKAALSDLVGIAAEITAPTPRPRERLQRLSVMRTGVFDVQQLIIAGGNPIGPEAKMLLEVLEHVEFARKFFDTPRAEKWRAIAIGLTELVQGNLAEAMNLARPNAEAENGRYR